MTGMCGGREDDDEDKGTDDIEVGGGRAHGEVLAGAGRSGGGEESVGDPLAEAAGGDVEVTLSPSRFSSCLSSVSVTMASGVAAVFLWWLVVAVIED